MLPPSMSPQAALSLKSARSDLRITNFGGGNTSAKVMHKDPLTGRDTEVLWVKGSGGDLGSMKLDGFATLYMDKFDSLRGIYRGLAHEDEMVGLFPHYCTSTSTRAPPPSTRRSMVSCPTSMSTMCIPMR